jgi:hypothetical protein
MQGFFKDYEIKEYTLNQKIMYILNQLIIEYKPKEIYRCYECDICIEKEKSIKNPFNIFVNINSDIIIISDTIFEYKFKPEYLLYIYNKFKKIRYAKTTIKRQLKKKKINNTNSLF